MPPAPRRPGRHSRPAGRHPALKSQLTSIGSASQQVSQGRTACATASSPAWPTPNRPAPALGSAGLQTSTEQMPHEPTGRASQDEGRRRGLPTPERAATAPVDGRQGRPAPSAWLAFAAEPTARPEPAHAASTRRHGSVICGATQRARSCRGRARVRGPLHPELSRRVRRRLPTATCNGGASNARCSFSAKLHRNVTDICLDVGFTSLGTFSRTFSEIVGESPTAYRAGHDRWWHHIACR